MNTNIYGIKLNYGYGKRENLPIPIFYTLMLQSNALQSLYAINKCHAHPSL